jgi:hypothetical protein
LALGFGVFGVLLVIFHFPLAFEGFRPLA